MTSPREIGKTNHSLNHWSKPPTDSIKLNFDGVARGNPSPTEVGGAFQDDTRVIPCVFAIHQGKSTNKVVELDGVIRGLYLAKNPCLQSLIVEGDSTIIIQALNGLLCGSNPNKMSHN